MVLAPSESPPEVIFYESTEDTSYVDSVVLVKTFILNGNYRMLQIHRNLFDGNRQTVGAWRSQLTQLVSVSVIQKGCISQRRNIHVICIRALSMIPRKAPMPKQPTTTQSAIRDMNRTLINETCARFPIMAVREIREFRFFETDFYRNS